MVGAGVPSTMPQSSLLDPSTGGYVPRPPLMMHHSYVLQVSQVGGVVGGRWNCLVETKTQVA